MRWEAILQGDRIDVERLLVHTAGALAPTAVSNQATLTITDACHLSASPEHGRPLIALAVRRINWFGKLSWGRAYRGVEIRSASRHVDRRQNGDVLIAARAVHLTAVGDIADSVNAADSSRRNPPVGLEDAEAVDFQSMLRVLDSDPEVARVLHLVEKALTSDAEVDWDAAHSAVDLIDRYDHDGGVCGEGLGWCTHEELGSFARMADVRTSDDLHERKAVPSTLDGQAMTTTAADLLLRRVTARWIVSLVSRRA